MKSGIVRFFTLCLNKLLKGIVRVVLKALLSPNGLSVAYKIFIFTIMQSSDISKQCEQFASLQIAKPMRIYTLFQILEI